MKAAFFHDTMFRYDKEGVFYTQGNLPYSLWKRYMKTFEALVVVARACPLTGSSEKCSVASGEGVVFLPAAGYRTPVDLLMSLRAIKEALSQVDCAIIRLPSFIGLMACHEAERLGKPWAVEVVGCAWEALWNYGSLLGKILALPMFFFSRHYIGKATHAIYVTREFLQRRYPCYGITEGVSDVEIDILSEELISNRLKSIEREYKNRPIHFGIIGSLDVGYKGQDIALRALALLKDSVDFRLYLLGTGNIAKWANLADQLEIGDFVISSGTLPSGEAVFEWLDDIDIFLMPSKTEGLPRSLVEAMSRGCPAIGSRVGGIVELLQPELMHTPGDYRNLAEIIKKVISDKELMIKYARQNFRSSREYDKHRLSYRRHVFWSHYKNYVCKKKESL